MVQHTDVFLKSATRRFGSRTIVFANPRPMTGVFSKNQGLQAHQGRHFAKAVVGEPAETEVQDAEMTEESGVVEEEADDVVGDRSPCKRMLTTRSLR